MSAPARRLSQVVIRPAEPEDLPVLGQLGALLVRLHHEFDPARFVAAPPRTEHLADQLRKRPTQNIGGPCWEETGNH